MPIQELNKPYTECYVFDDPTRVYDLVGWNPDEKLYKLVSDDGRKRYLRYFEFCPISSAHNEEIEAGDDGKIYTVQQLVDAQGRLAWKRPTWADAGAEAARPCASGSTGPDLRAQGRKAKDRPAKAHDEAMASGDEAKDAARALLHGLNNREELAKAAGKVLGETPESLVEKYAHLDNGRFRMTLGNRIVGIFKKQGVPK